MTISIDPATYVITIPKTDTTYVTTNATTGYEIRSYDEYAFMREFADYLDSEAGMGLPSGFTHNTSVTISGVVYARALVILAPFTVTFEDGVYQVKLVGGMNNNLLDVLNPNNVSVIPANSAGLQQVSGGSGLSTEEHDQLMTLPDASANSAAIMAAIVESGVSVQQALRLYNAILLGKVSGAGTGTEVFRDFNDTKSRVTATLDVDGNRTAVVRDAT